MGTDPWVRGDAYEAYVGRWSRRVAAGFVDWLEVPPQRGWLDVGCGTGALTAAVLADADPRGVVGIDPSEGFLETARARIKDVRVTFRVGDAQSLPVMDGHFADFDDHWNPFLGGQGPAPGYVMSLSPGRA